MSHAKTTPLESIWDKNLKEKGINVKGKRCAVLLLQGL
jgi:hypothetical protein